MNNIGKITNIILVALIVIAVVVIGMCFILEPGEMVVSDGTTKPDPHTGLFLSVIYVLVALAIILTLVTAVMQFAVNFSKDPKKAIIMLGGLGVLLLICLITYLTGNGNPMQIPGYEGNQNTEGWLKMCDMFLRTTYILLFVAVVAIIASPFAKKIK